MVIISINIFSTVIISLNTTKVIDIAVENDDDVAREVVCMYGEGLYLSPSLHLIFIISSSAVDI